jgi:hypothetical protein
MIQFVSAGAKAAIALFAKEKLIPAKCWIFRLVPGFGLENQTRNAHVSAHHQLFAAARGNGFDRRPAEYPLGLPNPPACGRQSHRIRAANPMTFGQRIR